MAGLWTYWSVGSPQLDESDPEYHIIVGRKALSGYPYSPLRWLSFDLQATLDYSESSPIYEPTKTFSQYVTANDLWLRSATGERYKGWRSTSPPYDYVVDLSLAGTDWVALILAVLANSRTAYPDIESVYFDDLADEPFKFGSGSYNRFVALGKLEAYEATSLAIAAALAGDTAMLNQAKFYNKPWSMIECFPYNKHEGFRWVGPGIGTEPDYWNAGWGGPEDDPFTWTDLWLGRADVIAGLRELMLHTPSIMPVIEAQYDEDWSAAKLAHYATVAVVTSLLAGCYLALHKTQDWYDPGLWTDMHDQALLLGDAVGAATLQPNGTWTRTFQHGLVMMNPTAVAVGECDPYSGFIDLLGPEPIVLNSEIATIQATESIISDDVCLDSPIAESVELESSIISSVTVESEISEVVEPN